MAAHNAFYHAGVGGIDLRHVVGSVAKHVEIVAGVDGINQRYVVCSDVKHGEIVAGMDGIDRRHVMVVELGDNGWKLRSEPAYNRCKVYTGTGPQN
ncbi:hypothetical protein ACLB2K_004756 [Fragaria x ananassa]